jgi:hypothetical protein
MRDEPTVKIRFDSNGRIYLPGETLSGEYAFDGLPATEGKRLEVSVLWFTEGKGEEDMAVHEFWRTNLEEDQTIDLFRPQRFSTTWPASPLSYDGRIVKIRWCVRVRVFLQGGKDVFGQKLFRLGDVPAIPPLPVPPAGEPGQ